MVRGVGKRGGHGARPSRTNKNWVDVTDAFGKKARAALLALRRDGDGNRAALLAEALVKDYPNSPLALHVFGHVHAALGSLDQALPQLRRAAEMVPGCLEIAFTLAAAYAKGKQFAPAAVECRRALDVVDPVDPRLHTVCDRGYLEPKAPARIAVAQEQLRGLLADSSSRSLDMAYECWIGLSEEEQRNFLTVSVEDLEAYYQSSVQLTEHGQMSVITDAMIFVKNTEAWVYWLCPQCTKVFLNVKFFQSHVENDHNIELRELLVSVPERIDDEETEFLESWANPMPTCIHPTGEYEGGNVVKIKSAILHLKDMKALSVALVEKLVKFTEGWIGKTTAIPQNLSCITSLDAVGLQVLRSYLERLQLSSRHWVNERAYGGVHNSCDASDVVIRVDDAQFLSVDIEKILIRKADGSSSSDELFSWLSRPSLEEPVTSWNSMRQEILARGTEVLQKINEMTPLLSDQIKLKCDFRNKHEDYFRTEASVDVEILRLEDQVAYWREKLVELCRFDYHAIVLPVMKAYLWAKLNNEPTGEVSQEVDYQCTDENLKGDSLVAFQNDNREAPAENIDDNLFNDLSGKGLPTRGDKGVNNIDNRDDSIVLQNVRDEDLPEDSNNDKMINDSTGEEKGLCEVDDKGTEENVKTIDHLDAPNKDRDKDNIFNELPGEGLPSMGDKGSDNIENRDDSIVFHNIGDEYLPEDSNNDKMIDDPIGKQKGLCEVDDKGTDENLKTIDHSDAANKDNLFNDIPGKGLPSGGDKVAENRENKDDSIVLHNVDDEDLLEDNNNDKMINDTTGKEKVLCEGDHKGAEETPKNIDHVDTTHKVTDDVLHEDHVLQSGQQLELPARAHEKHNLVGSEQTPMDSQDTSDFRTDLNPQASDKKEDFSGATKEVANVSINGENGTACEYIDIELQSLKATLLSLWHLRAFSEGLEKFIIVCPHFGVSGQCMTCMVGRVFSAWSDKDDRGTYILLKLLRTAFSKALSDANGSQKEGESIAFKIIDIIFNMVHTSQTSLRINCNTGVLKCQPISFPSCPGEKCLPHSHFGMCKIEEDGTCFLKLGASELQNTEMKSFGEVIKSVNKQFRCDVKSRYYNHPPLFLTTVFSDVSDKESHSDVSKLLASMAAPLDISPVYERLHSGYKYAMVSAVFRSEGGDICFARENKKWLTYEGNTVKVADTWQSVLDGYSQSRLYPQIIFFECINTPEEIFEFSMCM